LHLIRLVARIILSNLMQYIIRKSALIGFIYLTFQIVGCAGSAGSADENRSVNQNVKSATTPPPITDRPKIIAFGDSLTAGYGLDSWEKSYPALLQRSVDDAGYDYQVLNYGQGGDTAEGGLKRLWLVLDVSNTKIFVLALGANDVVKKIPPEQIRQNLSEIIQRVKAKNSKVLLCGIFAPTDYGEDYANEIKDMYAGLARENDIPLLPSLMQDVSGNPGVLLADGIHPNEEGARIIEKNVFAAVRPLLEKDDQKRNE